MDGLRSSFAHVARGWAAALAVASVLACGGSTGENRSGVSSLPPVPTPDLTGAVEGAREQIGRLEADLQARLADPGAGDVETAEAFGALGSVYLIYDYLDAATVSFRNAAALDRGDFRWPYYEGYVQQIQGLLDQAVPRLEAALRLDPDFTPATLRLGRARLALGELDAAEARFRAVLDADPASAPALEGLGQIAVARGDDEAAIGYLERAYEAAPEANSLAYALAQAHRRTGDAARAEAYLARRGDVAVRIPDPLISALGRLGESAQLFIVQGAEALENEDFAMAASAYGRALELDPARLETYRALAFAVERLGDRAGAIAHLETALAREVDPAGGGEAVERQAIQRILGGLLAAEGRDDQAATRLSLVVEEDPDDASTRLALADALARLGRFESALEHYDRLLEARPELARPLLEKRAVALVNLGRAGEARRAFDQAIAAAPDDPSLRARYADALAFLDDAEGAARQQEAAERLGREGEGEDRLRVVTEAARALVAQQRFEEAIQHFDEALRLAPDDQAVRFELASVLGHVGYYDDALREFRAVVEAQPRHADARRGEITVLLLVNRFGEARVRLNEALATFPLDADLALIQARLLACSPDDRVRDGALALEIAGRLDRVRQDRLVREAMAMALAAVGRFEEAADIQEALVRQAADRGETTLASAQQARLDRYRAGRPWSARSPADILTGAG